MPLVMYLMPTSKIVPESMESCPTMDEVGITLRLGLDQANKLHLSTSRNLIT